MKGVIAANSPACKFVSKDRPPGNGRRASLRNSRPMTHYRAYAVQFDGNFDGYQSLNCADDKDAIVKARQLAERSAIELWSGERFITRLEHKSR
jgi:hypothetical protein